MLRNILSVLVVAVMGISFCFAAEKADAKAEMNLSVVVKIDQPQISLNDSLLAIDRGAGVKVLLSPELSSPEMLKKQLELKTGDRHLRDLLDEICLQIGGSWKKDTEANNIQIEKGASGAVVTQKSEKPLESKLNVEYAGVSLAAVAADLQDKTGVVIEVPEKLRGQVIEVMVKGWELKRVLNHICFLYNLQYTTPKGKVVFSPEKTSD